MQMKSWLQKTTSVSIIKFKKSFCFYSFMIVIQVNERFILKTKNIIVFYFNSKKVKGKGE